MSINEEFVYYLKQGEFKLFMEAWKQQIVRLGHLGGTISVPLSEQSRKDIGGLLGKDFHKQSHAKITYSTLKKALSHSRFEECYFDEVLALYFHGEIITKKTLKELKEQKEKNLLNKMLTYYPDSKANEWLHYVMDCNDVVMSRIRQELAKHPSVLKVQLKWAMEALHTLPSWHQENQNLAIFASQITGNPHAFDTGKLANYFLFHGICYLLKTPYEKMNIIEKNNIFYQAGLYRDGVSNFCILAHIDAFQEQGMYHLGWHGFYEQYESWNVNIGNVQAIKEIDVASCPYVYVVENPSVFQYLVNIAKQQKLSNVGFLCTNGQLNFCGYLLMDRLYQVGIKMFYSGDMDPEGLLIADKVKQRYGEQLILWHYTREDYETSLSKEHADKRRLAVISKIQDEQLRAIGDCLKDMPIGYQENLLDVYKQDLIKV